MDLLRFPDLSPDSYATIMAGFWNFWMGRKQTLNIFRHYRDVIMNAMAFRIVCSTLCSGADQRKHQSSASLAFARGIHWWPMDSHHKVPVTREMFPPDDVIMLREVGKWEIRVKEYIQTSSTIIINYPGMKLRFSVKPYILMGESTNLWRDIM